MKNSFIIFLLLLAQIFSSQFTERSLAKEQWYFSQQGKDIKKIAKIPGDVHQDLMMHQMIPDPFKEKNEKRVQWIENENWIYETEFSVSKPELKNQNIQLVFDGIDTFAEVYLNQQKILDANNMFRKWEVDVKKALKPGKNQMKIVFLSASKRGKELAKNHFTTLPEHERSFVRKAQFQFGWDWSPRLLTAGIWKDVKLQFWNDAKIEHITFIQKKLDKNNAELDFDVQILVSEAGEYEIESNRKRQKVSLQKGENKIKISQVVFDPKLWWSNGLGKQNLYEFGFRLFKNSKSIDEKSLRVGLRNIELVQEKDEKGKSFYFKLNGVPVYMKGANYVPQDNFPSRVSPEQYRKMVIHAKNANMNMLRIWGGGIYPDDEFYNACDENGILVWQDFMFAGAMTPASEDFLKNVETEIEQQTKRLQNHPSIALWCGNNEIDEAWKNWGWQKQFGYSKEDSARIWQDYQKVFHELIPQKLNEILPKNENRYWESSPKFGWGRKESMTEGDSHYWGIWWGEEPFEKYREKTGRFMSEYGFQGMPNLSTFKKVTEVRNLSLESEEIQVHQKHPRGKALIQKYMERDFPVPQDLEEYIYVSQLLQSHGMKIAIDAHRKAKPYNMGTLYWQLNDSWPSISWSSVDYFRNWKALHYQAKKSYENVVAIVNETEENYEVYFVSDLLENVSGGFNINLISFDGKNLWNASAVGEIHQNTSELHFKIPKKDFAAFDLKKSVLQVEFLSEKITVKENFYFVSPKDLVLTKPNLKIVPMNDRQLEITTDVLAKNVFLSSENEVFFSDNYFDLLPGESRIINIDKKPENFKTFTLFDIFH